MAVALLAGTGCGSGNVYHEPPPPEVLVGHPVRRDVVSYFEQTGTAQASERVELRARVTGFLAERAFQDGDSVKAGQLLFVIDEEPFRIRLAQAKAKQNEIEAALRKAEQSKAREISQAQRELDQSELDLALSLHARTETLFARNATSREELERTGAALKRAQAQVSSDTANQEQIAADYETNILSARSNLEAAQADVRMAEIDLGYCRVTAPIDGRIDAREFDVGNYVGDGQSTVLATIVKVNPIYAYVTPSEGDLLRILYRDSAETSVDYRHTQIPIEMGLGHEGGYPHLGKVDYIDPSVDSGTGTTRVRGVFENPGGAIMPGLFVRVRLPSEQKQGALLVPDRAVGSDQGGSFLLVVGAEDKVERRQVEPGVEVDGMRVVEGKIGPEDRVVVDGLLRARPGMQVMPKLITEAAQATAEKSPPPTSVSR